MADQQPKLREVAWSALFPWLILFRTVRIALLARVLVLGALGLAATMLGWWLIADRFPTDTDPVITAWQARDDFNVWQKSIGTGASELWLDTSANSAAEVFESASELLIQAPKMIWVNLTRPFIDMFDGALTGIGFVFLLLCAVWELLVWGLFGGAITRIAALKFTRDEAPGILTALKHAATNLPSYSLPPLLALAGASVFAIQLVVLGAIMRVGVLAFVAAIVWPFALLLGLMMAILLLGALVGWPLMWATVSVEGTDAFDALSRSYAYTYHRPWRLLWYVIFAAFLAITSMFVVKLFASSAISLANWSIDWGLDEPTMRAVVNPRPALAETTDPSTPAVEIVPGIFPPAEADVPVESAAEPRELGKVHTAARNIIRFWKAVIAFLVAGYQAGFLWVAAVGIYLLLRRDIDGVQINEVYLDQAEEYGMPPLADDAATGVPEVATHQPAIPGDTRT